MPPKEPVRPENCPRCGAVFQCGVLAGKDHCWCHDLPPIDVSKVLTSCLCPTCLKQEMERGV
jgi:hypothetical protein